MAKAHAAEYGRSRADEYRRKAEACRVHAKRASGDWKPKCLDLADRWDEAADQVGPTQAAVTRSRVKGEICTFDHDVRLAPGISLVRDSRSLKPV
jgi:hypothetical protein